MNKHKQKSEMGGTVTAFGVDNNDPKAQEYLKKIDAALKRIFEPLNEVERTVALQLFSIRQVTTTMAHEMDFPPHVCAALMDSAIKIAKEIPDSIVDRKKVGPLLKQADKEVLPLVTELAVTMHAADCPHCKAKGAPLGELGKLWKGDSAGSGKPN